MPRIRVVAGIILRQNQLLIARRPLNQHKGGFWEFPGGKIEAGESPEQALSRELKEELNIQVNPEKCRYIGQLDFDYPDKQIELSFYRISEFAGEPEGLEGQPLRWVFFNELVAEDFPEANRPMVKRLIETAGY